jgi:hypothetical protein
MAYESGLGVPTESREPDFGSIFNSLRVETSRATEISKGTSYLGNSLKPMLQNKSNDSDKLSKEEPGIVGMLWTEIYKLREANNQAELTMNHIREIVGS